MMNEDSKIEELSDNLKEYSKIQYEIILLRLTDKSASLSSILILKIISGVIILNLLFCIGLAAGFYFADLFGNRPAGFALVAAVYLVVFIIYLVIRKKAIQEPIKDKIISELLKDQN